MNQRQGHEAAKGRCSAPAATPVHARRTQHQRLMRLAAEAPSCRCTQLSERGDRAWGPRMLFASMHRPSLTMHASCSDCSTDTDRSSAGASASTSATSAGSPVPWTSKRVARPLPSLHAGEGGCPSLDYVGRMRQAQAGGSCPLLMLAPMESLGDLKFRTSLSQTCGGFDEACTGAYGSLL
jgi:hypothetical protein